MELMEINDIKEPLVIENANLNHLNKENSAWDNLDETVVEQKLNSPLNEGPSEPSVCNSKTGGNEFTINNYPDPLINFKISI